MVKETWQMTYQEFVASNPELMEPERPLTLNEWRAVNNRDIPLTDHGAYVFPNGRSKAEERRCAARLAKWNASYSASSKEYYELLHENKIPLIRPVRKLSGTSGDLESNHAYFRSTYKRMLTKARSQGKPVMDEQFASCVPSVV